ncbi:MAG: SAM-dependent chlorinase/fluorinase, partial [Candidatus Bathyarchaeota archaeon]|nr:SAM-dependent chlorinase/fluorinase [Candidatus Bathyarchaeota archaeon]
MSIITLLTDFGLRDPYVAEMKAVILRISPDAKIVDISHEVKKFDVRMGAFILEQAARYFPDGTVHVAVVDPGVGMERRPIVVETNRKLYVGPDNGLLMLAALKCDVRSMHKITNPRYMLGKVSRTFHGRDIFSCAAAHLANGVPPAHFGPKIDNPVMPQFAQARFVGDKIIGEAIHIDGFGNIIANISLDDLGKIGIKEGGQISVSLKDRIVTLTLCLAYGEVSTGDPLSL